MASKKRQQVSDEAKASESVYVLSLVSVNHGNNHRPVCRNVGVYSTKAAAVAAAGAVDMEYGTFDSAIGVYFEDDHKDNREDPPDHGCLLQLGSPETGEGDYVRLNIEKFAVQSDTTAITAIKPYNQKADTAKPPAAKKPKVEPPKKREIDEADLLVIMKDIMKPAEHKRVTEKIQSLCQNVESEAVPLRHTRDHVFGRNVQPENLFEVHVGNFWGLFQTRDYMRARLALANEIHDKIAVLHPDTQAPWEVVLWHYQEMLRLCSSDNLGLRYRFPFLLLHLHRDDDAFCFIRCWIRGDDDEEEDDGDDGDDGHSTRQKLHNTSNEGDWLYGHETDSRFLDIFQACPKANFEYVCLPLLVALACVKMRIIAVADDIGHNKEPQRKQLNQIIHLIHKRNPTMLPALIHPTPLLSKPAPDYMSPGTPSECYSIVEDASPIWKQIPGAIKRLQDQFGKRPKYNCDLSD